ncbi:hypothetical protein ACQP2F_41245 [Actinoplanes sp. CA-030573]|uniref:hypothetical protein n=1 Tax=Actinoplanes sp. CA-030573 TaxID=3239898 RepID=UPI003D925B5F
MESQGTSWTDIAAVATATVSTLIALIAVVIAIRNDRRSRQVIKIQTYLALRSRFIEIYQRLGKLEDSRTPQDDVALRLTRQAYWHHCWDEWFISERLSPAEFGDMWKRFFSAAAESGLRHPALRTTLAEMSRDRTVGFGRYGRDLIDELHRLDESRLEGSDAAP